jgi:hypothetical protein
MASCVGIVTGGCGGGPSSSEGLLGADVMKEYGSAVFDYAGGRLFLGATS